MEMVQKETKMNFKSSGRKKIPALVEFFECVICNCKKSRYETNKCPCFSLDMNCAGLWNCKSCSNVYTNEDVETTEKDDDYENFDDDNWDDIIDDEEELLDNDDTWLGCEFLVKRDFLFVVKSNFLLLQRYSRFI